MVDVPPWGRKALRFWELPFLAVLAGFMFWVRMLPYQALLGQGRAYYIGTDPFYHYRETLGIVRSFPSVPRWDPFTFYPHGTATGQFGSLFDWSAALIVVLTKGRDAPELYVQQVLGVYPAVLGALLVVPFYFLAKRLLGTPGAVVASVTLALLPGEFLIRSLAGYADHHVAEAFFSVLAILGVVVAVERCHAARGLFTGWRPARGHLMPVLWGVLGGLALAANVYAWPPAILFGGILAVWLTIAILLENAKPEGDARGMAFGAVVSFVVAGLLLLPAIETTFLGEFNTYGLLQPLFLFAAAAWLVLVHAASHAARARRLSPWVVPAAIAGAGLALFLGVLAFASGVYSSLRWGLAWVTGIGLDRTTSTIAEARGAMFFCGTDSPEQSCLSNDFGLVAPITFLLLIAVVVFALVKRRRTDILLAVWSLVIFRATDTQIRFSYYLAINMALLVGWLAARVAEGTGLTREDEEEAAARPAAPVKGKGRKTRRAETAAKASRPLQLAAVAAVLLIVLPGNVLATERARPGWVTADFGGADGDLALWMDGLDWMRDNTPDAGVDLGLVIDRPAPGERYDYPPNAYGVLSWWDYGHWIEAVGRRPPVANPFQQAAPFASLWFTERDPAQAERMLDDWVDGQEPIRYVWIDDEMATGKYGAITVWANQNNASRAIWAGGDYIEQRPYTLAGRPQDLYTLGPEYRESMMGRLFDGDANGLSHYRLVWEHPQYRAFGNVVFEDGRQPCLHDAIPSRSCPVPFDGSLLAGYREGQTVQLTQGAHGYDLFAASRLKLFERVAGAHLTGTAEPGAPVVAYVDLDVTHPGDENRRTLRHRVDATAGPDGRFDLVFPYATTDLLGPDQGGTNYLVKALGPVTVLTGTRSATVDVPDRAVLRGEDVPVTFG